MKYSRKSVIPSVGAIVVLFASPLLIATSRAGNFTSTIDQSDTASPQTWTNAIWQPGSVSPSAGNTYEVVSGGFLQNPWAAGTQTFPGDSLTLDSGSRLMIVGFGGATLDFPGVNGNPGLVLNGGSVMGTAGQSDTIAGQVAIAADSFFGRSLVIAAQLTGSGNLTVIGGNGRPVEIRSADNPYSGNWVIQRGYLKGTGQGSLGTGSIVIGSGATFEVNYDLQSTGALTFSGSNSLMILHQDCQFSAVTINGTALPAGTYTYTQLVAQFPGSFANGGSGSITVPAPTDAGISNGDGQSSNTTTDAAVSSNSAVDGTDVSAVDTAASADLVPAQAAADITAPALSSGVMVSASSATQVTIFWNASTDPSGVGYNVYRNGVLIGTTTSTSYNDSGLSPNTQYCYTIVAYDGAGNMAPPSAQACTTTPGAPVQNTMAPTGVMAAATSATQVTISWNAGTDPNGLGYNVYRNGALIGTTTTTGYTDSGLSPNTQYCYTIVAYDGAENVAPPSAQACATTQNAPVPVVAEWYGPFASWGNIKTSYGAAGDGVTDDTTAIQAALTAVSTGTSGTTNQPSVIYFPKGTYRVTQTLTLLSRERFNIVADPGTRIVWAGASGGTLFHLDGCDSGYFARLTFDGGGIAAVVFDHTKLNGTYFDTDNVFEDCAFVNGGTGMRGGAAGQGFASIMFRRCTFGNCTVDGASVNNWNALDGYLVDCLVTNCTVGMHIYEGSLHPYRSLFVNNGIDIRIEQGVPFESIVSNQSFNAGQFIYSQSIGQNGGEILVKDNLVVDSSSSKPAVEMGVMGPLMFLDNTFANSGTTNAIRFFNSYGPDVSAIGNQYTMPNLMGIEWAWLAPRTNMVDNAQVSRSSLNLTRMTLPAAATNLNRHTIEVSVNAGDSEIQAAIYSVTNWAGQGPVVHIPAGLHTMMQTIVVPGGLDVTLLGDGWNDQFQWGTTTGKGPMFRLQAPARAGLQQFSATEFAKGDGVVFVEGASTAGSRVLLQDCSVSQAVSQNIWMDDCPNLTVEMDGDGHGSTQAGGTNGVSIEQTGRGKFRLFCADSGSNWRTYRSETNGEMYIETSWYEDHTADTNFASIAGAGTVTFLSGKMASGGSGQYLTLDSFQVNNWSGQFTFALMGVTDVVNLSGSGAGSVWLTSDTGSSLANWFVNTSSGLTVEATENDEYLNGLNRLSDAGVASAAFTRQMLTKARQEFMVGPVISATPSRAADVRLIRFNAQQGVRNIAIYSGTAP